MVFRERVRETEQPMLFRDRNAPAAPESKAEGGGPGGPPPAGAAAPAEPGRADTRAESRLSDDYAATGIGREVDHRVERVRFDTERAAAASLEVRYEFRPALVKLGLLPRVRPSDPLERRERAHGFEPGYAPDPYRPNGRD